MAQTLYEPYKKPFSGDVRQLRVFKHHFDAIPTNLKVKSQHFYSFKLVQTEAMFEIKCLAQGHATQPSWGMNTVQLGHATQSSRGMNTAQPGHEQWTLNHNSSTLTHLSTKTNNDLKFWLKFAKLIMKIWKFVYKDKIHICFKKNYQNKNIYKQQYDNKYV